MAHDEQQKSKKRNQTEYLLGPTCHPFGPRESSIPGRYPRCLTLPQERKKRGPPNENTLYPRRIGDPERGSNPREKYPKGLKQGPIWKWSNLIFKEKISQDPIMVQPEKRMVIEEENERTMVQTAEKWMILKEENHKTMIQTAEKWMILKEENHKTWMMTIQQQKASKNNQNGPTRRRRINDLKWNWSNEEEPAHMIIVQRVQWDQQGGNDSNESPTIQQKRKRLTCRLGHVTKTENWSNDRREPSKTPKMGKTTNQEET